MNNHDEKQVGSNLTGAAIPGKPGHQRDIPIPVDPTIEIEHEDKDDLSGDVNPTGINEDLQEDTNSKKEDAT